MKTSSIKSRAKTEAIAWAYLVERGYAIPIGVELQKEPTRKIDMLGRANVSVRKDGAPKAFLTGGFVDIVAGNWEKAHVICLQVTALGSIRSRLKKMREHPHFHFPQIMNWSLRALGVKTIPNEKREYFAREFVWSWVAQDWVIQDLWVYVPDEQIDLFQTKVGMDGDRAMANRRRV